jgi:hypothetical protein
MKIIKSQTIFYGTNQLRVIKDYKVLSKVNSANKRFIDKRIAKHDVLTVLEKFNFRCIYCDLTCKTKYMAIRPFLF